MALYMATGIYAAPLTPPVHLLKCYKLKEIGYFGAVKCMYFDLLKVHIYGAPSLNCPLIFCSKFTPMMSSLKPSLQAIYKIDLEFPPQVTISIK